MLSAIRVLDLSDDRGQLCGEILAQLGAEVILVEPPGGSPARSLGPFAGDVPDPEASLFFWAYNRGKQSVTLDLASAAGQAALLELAAGADVVISSADPGSMEARGLGPADLAARNPALITVSITAFGSDGPKAGWQASDLTVVAASGQLVLTGDDDRPPLRIPIAQAFHHAAAEAAAATLIALYERQHHSGLGQHIDCSAQQSTMHASQSMMLAHPLGATSLTRVAGGVKVGPVHLQLMWPAKDGYVSVTFLFGAAIGPFTTNLMRWVHEEGFCDEATANKDFLNYAALIFSGQEPLTEYGRMRDILTEFFATKTKAELLEAAFERRLLIAPVTTTEEVLASPHLAEREFWQDVDHGGRAVRYPGAPAKLSETPLPSLPAAPPAGRDTALVLAAPARVPSVPAGLAGGQAGGQAAGVGAARNGRALDGLKVLDFCWVMAGPAGSRVLADYGATIVRVESVNRVDTARTLQPFRDNGMGADDSGLFNNMNAGKLGLALDLSKPAAREVVLDLVRWADVVVESFSPKAMRAWGLDYGSLREVNPDIVMLSSCLMGQTGPWANLAGFGTMAAAISGFFNITGWPDRAPSGPFGAYTDYTSPRLMAAVLLAALEHRRATGQGQYIDLSQAEASMAFLAPALLDQSVNGRVAQRAGLDDARYSPHGVYPCSGEDSWVAVAVTDDAMWSRCCGVLGREDLAGLVVEGRRARRDELDALIGGWTSGRTPLQAQDALQAAGVAAHQVQNSAECFADPQLAHRRHFREVSHATQGTTWVEGTRFVLSRTPAQIDHGGPTVGQHTFEVLSELLGYDTDRIADLAAAELLE